MLTVSGVDGDRDAPEMMDEDGDESAESDAVLLAQLLAKESLKSDICILQEGFGERF